MNAILCRSARATDSQLERMVEPLASYICSTERPRSALMSALAALRSEVEQTQAAALVHVNAFSENHRP